MQLDIFEHSHDVILRNAVIDALRARDSVASTEAIAALAAEYRGDPLLKAFTILRDRLNLQVTAPLEHGSAARILRMTEDAVVVAQQVMGVTAGAWLSPLWVELAAAITDYPFDPRKEALHAAPLLLRAERWIEANARIEAIPSWRRLPAPLAWRVEATYRISGLGAVWPLLAELSWMAPGRAAALAPRLADPELNEILRRFDAEFEGEGEPEDFGWFPAWTLIAEPHWAVGLRLAQAGAGTPAERCARQVLGLLVLERQGRHTELIEGRKRLRDLHRPLFDLYMRSR